MLAIDLFEIAGRRNWTVREICDATGTVELYRVTDQAGHHVQDFIPTRVLAREGLLRRRTRGVSGKRNYATC